MVYVKVDIDDRSRSLRTERRIGETVKEIDIEFLSSDPVYYNTIHYTNQPGSVGGVPDSNAAKVVTVSQDLTCVLSQI